MSTNLNNQPIQPTKDHYSFAKRMKSGTAVAKFGVSLFTQVPMLSWFFGSNALGTAATLMPENASFTASLGGSAISSTFGSDSVFGVLCQLAPFILQAPFYLKTPAELTFGQKMTVLNHYPTTTNENGDTVPIPIEEAASISGGVSSVWRSEIQSRYDKWVNLPTEFYNYYNQGRIVDFVAGPLAQKMWVIPELKNVRDFTPAAIRKQVVSKIDEQEKELQAKIEPIRKVHDQKIDELLSTARSMGAVKLGKMAKSLDPMRIAKEEINFTPKLVAKIVLVAVAVITIGAIGAIFGIATLPITLILAGAAYYIEAKYHIVANTVMGAIKSAEGAMFNLIYTNAKNLLGSEENYFAILNSVTESMQSYLDINKEFVSKEELDQLETRVTKETKAYLQQEAEFKKLTNPTEKQKSAQRLAKHELNQLRKEYQQLKKRYDTDQAIQKTHQEIKEDLAAYQSALQKLNDAGGRDPKLAKQVEDVRQRLQSRKDHLQDLIVKKISGHRVENFDQYRTKVRKKLAQALPRILLSDYEKQFPKLGAVINKSLEEVHWSATGTGSAHFYDFLAGKILQAMPDFSVADSLPSQIQSFLDPQKAMQQTQQMEQEAMAMLLKNKLAALNKKALTPDEQSLKLQLEAHLQQLQPILHIRKEIQEGDKEIKKLEKELKKLHMVFTHPLHEKDMIKVDRVREKIAQLRMEQEKRYELLNEQLEGEKITAKNELIQLGEQIQLLEKINKLQKKFDHEMQLQAKSENTELETLNKELDSLREKLKKEMELAQTDIEAQTGMTKKVIELQVQMQELQRVINSKNNKNSEIAQNLNQQKKQLKKLIEEAEKYPGQSPRSLSTDQKQKAHLEKLCKLQKLQQQLVENIEDQQLLSNPKLALAMSDLTSIYNAQMQQEKELKLMKEANKSSHEELKVQEIEIKNEIQRIKKINPSSKKIAELEQELSNVLKMQDFKINQQNSVLAVSTSQRGPLLTQMKQTLKQNYPFIKDADVQDLTSLKNSVKRLRDLSDLQSHTTFTELHLLGNFISLQQQIVSQTLFDQSTSAFMKPVIDGVITAGEFLQFQQQPPENPQQEAHMQVVMQKFAKSPIAQEYVALSMLSADKRTPEEQLKLEAFESVRNFAMQKTMDGMATGANTLLTLEAQQALQILSANTDPMIYFAIDHLVDTLEDIHDGRMEFTDASMPATPMQELVDEIERLESEVRKKETYTTGFGKHMMPDQPALRYMAEQAQKNEEATKKEVAELKEQIGKLQKQLDKYKFNSSYQQYKLLHSQKLQAEKDLPAVISKQEQLEKQIQELKQPATGMMASFSYGISWLAEKTHLKSKDKPVEEQLRALEVELTNVKLKRKQLEEFLAGYPEKKKALMSDLQTNGANFERKTKKLITSALDLFAENTQELVDPKRLPDAQQLASIFNGDFDDPEGAGRLKQMFFNMNHKGDWFVNLAFGGAIRLASRVPQIQGKALQVGMKIVKDEYISQLPIAEGANMGYRAANKAFALDTDQEFQQMQTHFKRTQLEARKLEDKLSKLAEKIRNLREEQTAPIVSLQLDLSVVNASNEKLMLEAELRENKQLLLAPAIEKHEKAKIEKRNEQLQGFLHDYPASYLDHLELEYRRINLEKNLKLATLEGIRQRINERVKQA